MSAWREAGGGGVGRVIVDQLPGWGAMAGRSIAQREWAMARHYADLIRRGLPLPKLGAVGEPDKHRLPLAASNAVVECPHMGLKQISSRGHTRRRWSSHVRTAT